MPKSAELILQPHLSSVVLVEPFGPVFAAISEKLSSDPTMQVVECVSAMDTLSVVRQMESCVILAHAATANDVNQHVTLLKTLGQQIQRKTVRILVTASSSLSTELIEKLTVYGTTEIMPDVTPAKALLFKLERHLKALPKAQAEGETEAVRVAGGGGGRPGAPQPAELTVELPPAVQLVEALTLEKDCWCLGGGGVRRADRQWRVRIKGPAPDQGRWVPADKGSMWVWQPNEADGVGGGVGAGTGWFFGGEQKPEFQRGVWTFTSERPWLGYLDAAGEFSYKFRLSDTGVLAVAADSDAALSWMQIARSSASRKAAQHEMQVALAAALEQTPEAVKAAERPARIVFRDPLRLLSDFWLLDKFQPKQVAGRWLFTIVGPGAAVGRWKAQDGKQVGGSERWWRWIPDAGERDPFMQEKGSWFFFGLIPTFAHGLWSFASNSPELGFYYQGRCYGSKFRWSEDERVLEIARDSAVGQEMLPLIKSSFERAVAPRPEGHELPPPAFSAEGFPVERGDPRSDFVVSPDAPGKEHEAIQSAPKASGLKKIFAAEAPGPTLSPLALVFLASELVTRRAGDHQARCDRYCDYLYASFGGLRVELWIQVQGRWMCVGHSEGGEPRLADCASAGPGLRSSGGAPALVVEVRPALQDPVGMLVVAGKGAQKIELDYARAAGRASVGLVLGAKIWAESQSEPAAQDEPGAPAA